MTGDGEIAEIVAINRNQFTDFQGSPELNLLAFDASLVKSKAYAGIFVSNQRKGISLNSSALASYSYRVNFSSEVFLKFGFSLGVFDQSVNFSKLAVVNYSDPHLFTSEQRRTVFDGNAGFSLYAKGFNIAASVPQIFASRLNFNDASGTRAYYQMSRHFLGTIRYNFKLSEGASLSPLAFVRYVQGAPIQYDAGIRFNLESKFWLSALYRNDFALGLQGGITLNRRFSVAYSYDYMVGDIASYAGMSHEIMLSVKIGKLKPGKGDDTLSTQDKKIIELQQQIDELKKNGVKSTKNENNKTTDKSDNVVKAERRTFTGKNSTKEEGIFLVSNKASDFTFTSGTPAKKGYYAVVETLFYLGYAEEEMKRYSNFGFPDTDIIIDKKSKFYYVYVYLTDNKDDAIKSAKDALRQGVGDCWVQVLVE